MAKRPGLDEVERRLDAGETVKAIAADLGVTERTIRNRLHAAGLPLARERPRGDRGRRLSDPVWLRGQFVDDARSPWAIAKGLGLSAAEVRVALDGLGIERPPVHPELTEAALTMAFANGASVKSIAKAAGVDRTAVRREMRALRHREPEHLAEATRRVG